MTSPEKFAAECKADYIHYRAWAAEYARGSLHHGAYIKLAWLNRRHLRFWKSEIAA